MRENKFRAWNEETKRMMYNFNIVSHGEYNILKLSQTLRYFYTNLIIEEYTGCKDIEGVDICEGDICKDIEGNTYILEFSDWLGGFTLKTNGKENQIITLYNLDCIHKSQITVIGNIHENPELLEGVKIK